MWHIISDGTGVDGNLPWFIKKYDIRQWIYIGEDSTRRIRLESIIGSAIPRIQFTDLLEKTAQELRQPFIDWIGRLSVENTSEEWWSSEIAAKNPFYNLFIRICLLSVASTIIPAQGEGNTLTICSTECMAGEIGRICRKHHVKYIVIRPAKVITVLNALKARARNTIFFLGQKLPPVPFLDRLSGTYALLLERHIDQRGKILERYSIRCEPLAGPDSVLFFTWVDTRNITKDNRYSDQNFGVLPEKLRGKGYKVGFLARILPSVPFEVTVKNLRKTSELLYYPEMFISAKDWEECRSKAFSFSPRNAKADAFSDFCTELLVQENIEETRARHVDSLLVGKMIAHMAQAGILPGLILYTCEGHSWESSLIYAVRRHLPSTKVVGYDNLTFSRMVLSMFPSRMEDGIRPAPDRIVTNGELYRETLIGEGIRKERVMRGCALRNQYLFTPDGQLKEIRRSPVSGPTTILVATTINTGESIDIISKVIRAFGGDAEYEIILKCHPLSDLQMIQSYLSSLPQYRNIKLENRPITELLEFSQYLVYSYTTVCFDALLYDVIPIWIKAENFVNLDKLDSVPEVRYVASTAEDLRNLVTKLNSLSSDERESLRERSQSVLSRAFCPVTDEAVDAFLP